MIRAATYPRPTALLLIGALIAVCAMPVIRRPFAQIIQGDVSVWVVDGDSINIGTVRIRLYGIDAPEANQRCKDAQDQVYACGSLATSALEEEIAGGKVVCDAMGTDYFKRTVAVCRVNGRDLGEAMVRRGYAIEFKKYSDGRYAAAEREAREAKRGLWAGHFQAPRDFRKEHRR